MVDSNKPAFAPGIDGLKRLIAATSLEERQSEKKVLERLLVSLGYYMPKLIRPQLKVKLNNNLKTFLKQKEEEIIDKLKSKNVPGSTRTLARYIIRTTLCNHCCDDNKKKIKKNDVDQLLGYCGRTMRLLQNIWKDDFLSPDSKSEERKIYLELCSDLEQFAI